MPALKRARFVDSVIVSTSLLVLEDVPGFLLVLIRRNGIYQWRKIVVCIF